MAKNKLIICKACDGQIAANAKSCPHCGAKNKKPFYKKAWFWVLVVVILFATAGGEESGPETQPSEAPASTVQAASTTPQTPVETEAPEGDVQTEYRVGDQLSSNGLSIVYMASGEYISDNPYDQPAEGNRYIFLRFAFENTSSSDRGVSLYDFECYADGYNAEMQYLGEDTLSATLSAGRSTWGNLYFEVPVDAQVIEIEYTENMFSDKKLVFLYEGDQDSGYILEANVTASENALAVGQVAESKQLKISYLNCYQDSSGNQYIVPKDGFRFITCEFEFENLSDADQFVSAYSFDCFADGISCESGYFRDDELSATLSSGRKARGTVTFEVPIDAQVIEVEYLSNFWTSNRVVFTANTQ